MESLSFVEGKRMAKSGFSLYDILLCIQLTLTGVLFFLDESKLFYISGAIGAFAIAYWVIECKSRKIVWNVLAIIALVAFCMTFNYILYANYPFLSIIREPIVSLSVALLIMNIKQSRFFYFVVFVVASIYLLFQISLVGFNLYEENVLKHSRNYVILYVFLFALPYYFACFRDGQKTSWIPAAVCVVVAFISIGRGNIITSLLWLGLIGFTRVFNNNGKYRFIKVLIILIVAGGLVYLFTSAFIEKFLFRFEERDASEDPRWMLMWFYWNTLISNPIHLLLGCQLELVPTLNYYEHLHNSYLMVHCYMGLLGLGVFFIGVVRSIKKLVRSKSYDLLILLFVFMVRAFSDWFFPLMDGSILMWFIIVFPIFFSRINKQAR